jgi:hypothetical protein
VALNSKGTPGGHIDGGTRPRVERSDDAMAKNPLPCNRSRIAGEPRLQAFLQSWRAMTGGAVEIGRVPRGEGEGMRADENLCFPHFADLAVTPPMSALGES